MIIQSNAHICDIGLIGKLLMIFGDVDLSAGMSNSFWTEFQVN
jgi:hypothetical protein